MVSEIQPPADIHTARVSVQERRWALGITSIVMLATTVPYLLGYAMQGMGAGSFTGFLIGVGDGNSYIAKMLAGATGAWLFRSPYTAFPQQGVFMFLPYLLLGKLAAPPALHEQLVVLFHLFRIGAGLLAGVATYDFLAYFIRDVRLRRFGLALAILGGGLGWLLVLVGRQNWLGSLPLEFYSPESFGFLEYFGLPHLLLARAFLLWTLLSYLRAVEEARGPGPQEKGDWLKAGLRISALWLFSGLMQPLDLAVTGILMAWYLAGLALWQIRLSLKHLPADWQKWGGAARLAILAGVLPGAYALYNLWIAWRDPYVRVWTAQNYLPSPHPLHYLLAYGLVLPYAVLGACRILRVDLWKGWLLAGWSVLLLVLVYLPVGFQRRLAEGVWLAFVALTMVSLETFKDNAPTKAASATTAQRRFSIRRVAGFLPLWLLFPSTLFLWSGGLLAAGNPRSPVFLPSAEASVFEYLAANAAPGEVVLASFDTSNALPAWAPLRVLVGLGPESANQAVLLPQVASFYRSSTSDAQRLDLLRRWEVHYVFSGPSERLLGDWDPAEAGYLTVIHQVGEFSVFRVLPSP